MAGKPGPKTPLSPSRAKAVYEQIEASKLVTRLTKHAMGELKEPMDASQVQAAKILLDKALSNAPQRSEISGPNGEAVPHHMTVTFVNAPRSES